MWTSDCLFFSRVVKWDLLSYVNKEENLVLLLFSHETNEPRHKKMCLREFPTRPDTN